MAIAQTTARPIKMGQVVLRSGTFTLSGGATSGTITVGGGGMKAFGVYDDAGVTPGTGTIDPDYAASTLAIASFTANAAGHWWAITKP